MTPHDKTVERFALPKAHTLRRQLNVTKKIHVRLYLKYVLRLRRTVRVLRMVPRWYGTPVLKYYRETYTHEPNPITPLNGISLDT